VACRPAERGVVLSLGGRRFVLRRAAMEDRPRSACILEAGRERPRWTASAQLVGEGQGDAEAWQHAEAGLMRNPVAHPPPLREEGPGHPGALSPWALMNAAQRLARSVSGRGATDSWARPRTQLMRA